MIDDANGVPSGICMTADVCVIGGGASGISLALSLSGKGISVLVLESGGIKQDKRTQALYNGEVANDALHSPADKYRLRCFGGSTVIWGGRCVPFDPIDFEARDFLGLPGWPITYADVAPFYRRANALAEAGQFEYDADKMADLASHPMIAGFHSAVVRTNSLERFSCPTNFARRYARRLQRAADVRVVLGANCTAIRMRPDGEQVASLDVATLAGNKFSVSARLYVLAVGGLETARLLLASRDVRESGVGNEHGVVGRYYMCHIAGNTGELSINGPTTRVRHGYEVAPEGVYCRRRLSLTPSEQRRMGLLNMTARLHFPSIPDPSHRNGVLSGLFLARRAISYEYGKRLSGGGKISFTTYAKHCRNVLMNPIDICAFLSHWIVNRTLAERKYPSVILRNKDNRFSLEINAEQLPQASSRVTLVNTVDELGLPQLKVDWRYSPADIDSVRRTLDVFSTEFQQSGAGRLEFDHETLEADLTRFGAYGGHHLGTARMGTDAHNSVVNSDCRVHSVRNLYVAGSAVFATSSQANPTLTIIALCLRLAEHLLQRVGKSALPDRVVGTDA
jgi:choline dehydrogenase-like flavoprotein